MKRLDPRRVFELFEDVSSISRCTGDEEAISNFIEDFAKNLGLRVNKDSMGNLIIWKNGSNGYENATPIILQGHMDMLCIQLPEAKHDFTKDGLKLSISGDLLYAKETSLGSDNGIALAFYMALLESSDIAHPPLEVILTVQEQAGLVGAKAVDVSALHGRYLINMDSEAEGMFITGCSGEVRYDVSFDLERVTHDFDTEVTLRISGLKGGHSGLNIHKNRGNAAQLLAWLYRKIEEVMPVSLISMCAGDKFNIIPYYGELRVCIPHDTVESFKAVISETGTFFESYCDEPELQVEFEICKAKKNALVLSQDASNKLIDYILLLPIGVNQLSGESKELVDTSLSLGKIRVYDEHAELKISTRSMTDERQNVLIAKLEILSKLMDAQIEEVNRYPSWRDSGDNHLRRLFKQAYREQIGTEASTVTIHAGLECSILAQKLNARRVVPPVEMISFGPDIFDAQTPEEAMSISSVRRTWNLFLSILKMLHE